MRISHRRAGISELLATLIMIAVTLIAGTAAFGWILLQTGSSENSYVVSVAGNVNFLNERFTQVSQAFYGPSNSTCPASGYPGNPGECSLAFFWYYNTGSVVFTLFSIQIVSLTTPPDGNNLNVLYTKGAFVVNSPALAGCTNLDVADGFPLGVNGFKPTGPFPLPLQSLSGPYRIAMPTCSGTHLYLFDGTTYTVTFTGLYGNKVTQSITPNG